MQFQQINLNEFSDLSLSNGTNVHRQIVGNIDLQAYAQRAHSERAAITAQGFAGVRKAVMRLFA